MRRSHNSQAQSKTFHCRLTSPTGERLFKDGQQGLLWQAAKLHQGHATGSRDIQNGWIPSGQPSFRHVIKFRNLCTALVTNCVSIYIHWLQNLSFIRSQVNIYAVSYITTIKMLFILRFCVRWAFEILALTVCVCAVFVFPKPITVLFNVFYKLFHTFCLN
jgi:hypothetical protein